MAKRRVRIEFEDGEGERYTISMDGKVSRDKIIRLLDMVELIGGDEVVNEPPTLQNTTFNKIQKTIVKKFTFGVFTSMDMLEAYEDEYNTPIKLSTVSTYLQRLTGRGVLTRSRTDAGWVYRRTRSNLQT